MKIRHKVLVLFAIGMLGMLVIAGVGMKSLIQDEEVFQEMSRLRMPLMESLLRLRGEITDLARRSYEIASKEALEPDVQAIELRRMVDLEHKAQEMAKSEIARIAPTTDEGRALWGEFLQQWESWNKYDIEIVRALDVAVDSGSPEKAADLFRIIQRSNTERRDTTPRMLASLDALTTMQSKLSDQAIADAESGTWRDFKLMCGCFVIALGLLGGFTWSVMVTVIKPLHRMRDLVGEIRQSLDLTRRIENRNHDELGEMARSFDEMMDTLRDTFLAVREQVDEVGKTVESVATAADQVARSSASQSSSASAMAASIEQMSVSINTVSGSASEARSIAQDAGDISEQGSRIIEQTRDGMVSIASSVSSCSKVIELLGDESRQISSVVNVIKEVADQTNLLALNAAIEAARAGEQGRGFAVVADEVRKLAERTAQSTVDIGSMVEKIQTSASEAVVEMGKVVKEVEAGKALAQDAGERMRAIRDEAARVSNAVTEISDALKEQSQASHDVARHVESIAQMTDENNAAAEEAAANPEPEVDDENLPHWERRNN